MVQQNVVAAQLFKQVVRFRGQAQLARHVDAKLQIRPLHSVVNVEETRKIDRAVSLAAVVQFRAHRFQQIARFFFLKIKIAVARNAEGG